MLLANTPLLGLFHSSSDSETSGRGSLEFRSDGPFASAPALLREQGQQFLRREGRACARRNSRRWQNLLTMTLRLEDVQAAQAVQQVAAHADEAQVRLVAGPGTGKSSTIEERVCWLLREGVDASSIAELENIYDAEFLACLRSWS
jgi:hypothetical protein